MNNKQKIRNVSIDSMLNLSIELHQKNNNLDKRKIEQKVADYLIENGNKAFCVIYNQAVVEGKTTEVLQTLKLV